MRTVVLGDLMVARADTLNPAAFPDEEFELYSIPAHDRGSPEIARGAVIGSVKQVVQPGDVMVSKIIPHIRRARVVGAVSGRRQIASGEWIVFRGDLFDPGYLRHLLVSDRFHAQYMNTVAGVGGSLVRARPQQVKSIPIPLPPLDEQRRIAAILDQADALRVKRLQVLAHLDTLTHSTFYFAFGDVLTNERKWLEVAIGEIAVRVTDGEHKTPQRSESGIPLLSARNVRDGWIDFENCDFVDEAEYAVLSRRVEPRTGDILISCSGTIGRVARVRDRTRFAMVRSAALVRPDASVHPAFLEHLLASPTMRATMVSQANSSAQANLFQNQIKRLPAFLPPLELQHEFAARVESLEDQKAAFEKSRVIDNELFASLQSHAFRGKP